MLWVNTWAYAPATSLGGLVLLLVFPEGRLLSPRWRPALWAALAFILLSVAGYAFIPQSMGVLFRNLPNPYTVPRLDALFEAFQALAMACGLAAAAGGGGERDAALAPGRPGRAPAAQVVPGRAAADGCLPHRDPGRSGPVEPGARSVARHR